MFLSGFIGPKTSEIVFGQNVQLIFLTLIVHKFKSLKIRFIASEDREEII